MRISTASVAAEWPAMAGSPPGGAGAVRGAGRPDGIDDGVGESEGMGGSWLSRDGEDGCRDERTSLSERRDACMEAE